MQSQGGTLVKHYRSMAFMGFWEVIQEFTRGIKNLRQCKEDILSYKPHALILVDYPGFNLQLPSLPRRESGCLLHGSQGVGMERVESKIC